MKNQKRSKEERYIQIVNYIIDHPNCNTSQIQQTINLQAQYLNEIILSMRLDRLITIKHIKTLRKEARLITITRKGIEEIYGKLENECKGCEEELGQAIMYQDEEELYYATSIDNEYEDMIHFKILMVNDKGEIQVW